MQKDYDAIRLEAIALRLEAMAIKSFLKDGCPDQANHVCRVTGR